MRLEPVPATEQVDVSLREDHGEQSVKALAPSLVTGGVICQRKDHVDRESRSNDHVAADFVGQRIVPRDRLGGAKDDDQLAFRPDGLADIVQGPNVALCQFRHLKSGNDDANLVSFNHSYSLTWKF